MTTPIRLGGPRRQSSRADTHSLGVMWQSIAGKMGLRRTPEQRDQEHADRAVALAAFLNGHPVSGIWPDHIKPMFLALHDETYADMMRAFQDAAPESALRTFGGGLLMLQRWAKTIDSTITLGAGAMQRLADRQLRSQAAAEAGKEASATR